MNTIEPKKKSVFTRYEIFVIAILAIVQFTVILDFMVLSPLCPQLMLEMNITTAQFGIVVSAYAFSAGIAGFLAAGFADKFDRKKLLLFFYAGFIIGTFLCGIANNYAFLLIARIVTGIFGGVLGSIGFAIITDLFALEVRGRVMGTVQTAFAASQVLGLPIGLKLANLYGWHSPFMMIVGFSIIVVLAVLIYLKPVTSHLAIKMEHSPFEHLGNTISQRNYRRAFLATVLMATGGFMMMPFGTAFSIFNLGISMDDLPLLYTVTGIFSIGMGPLIGKLADKIGKYKVFILGSAISALVVVVYTNLGITPLWIVIAINVVMFAGISSRMISASTLFSAIPAPKDRGAFMSINSSVQQLAGGVAAIIAGMIVVKTPSGKLEHYNTLGYVVIGTMIFTVTMMYFINQYVTNKLKQQQPVTVTPQGVEETAVITEA
jgi:predicted MFS family arabinose efflux permease